MISLWHWFWTGDVTLAPASWLGTYFLARAVGRGVHNIWKFGEAEAAKKEGPKRIDMS